jgi:hypothetical protein
MILEPKDVEAVTTAFAMVKLKLLENSDNNGQEMYVNEVLVQMFQ